MISEICTGVALGSLYNSLLERPAADLPSIRQASPETEGIAFLGLYFYILGLVPLHSMTFRSRLWLGTRCLYHLLPLYIASNISLRRAPTIEVQKCKTASPLPHPDRDARKSREEQRKPIVVLKKSRADDCGPRYHSASLITDSMALYRHATVPRPTRKQVLRTQATCFRSYVLTFGDNLGAQHLLFMIYQ